MAIPVARAAGAASVFAIDVNPAKLELAKRLGADATFLATQPRPGRRDQAADQRRRRRRAAGDVGQRRRHRHGLQMVRNGGTAALLGIPSDAVSINLAERIIFKGLTVLGINGRRMFETWYQTRGAGQERTRRSARRSSRTCCRTTQFDRAFELMAKRRSGQDRLGFQRRYRKP